MQPSLLRTNTALFGGFNGRPTHVQSTQHLLRRRGAKKTLCETKPNGISAAWLFDRYRVFNFETVRNFRRRRRQLCHYVIHQHFYEFTNKLPAPSIRFVAKNISAQIRIGSMRYSLIKKSFFMFEFENWIFSLWSIGSRHRPAALSSIRHFCFFRFS